MNPPTFGDLVDFVMFNRGTTTFMGFDERRIAGLLIEGISHNTLYYSLDSNNKINGMILAIKDDIQKILYVTENLSMSLTNLCAFAKRAKVDFEGYRLMATRHGKERKFDTNKLYNKLIKD